MSKAQKVAVNAGASARSRTVPTTRNRAQVLVAGSILQLFLGILYVWSVFVAPVSELHGWDPAAVKLTSSYMLCCFAVGILLGGKLQVKIGTTKVALMGGLALAVGMLVASIAPDGAIWLLYAGYGVIGGLGVGMGYNASLTSAQRAWPEKRGLAIGISVGAFGAAAVVFAPLVESMVGAIGLNLSLRILAAAFALVTVLLARWIVLLDAPAPAAAAQAAVKTADGAADAAPVPAAAPRQYTTMQMLGTASCWCIMPSLMLGIACYFVLNPSFKSLALERGLAAPMGTALVMVAGVANALGRLGVPALSDRLGRRAAAVLIGALTAASAGILIFAQGWLFLGIVAVVAFCYGGYSGVYPLLVGEAFGYDNIGANWGAVMSGFAVSALITPMLIALIPNQMVVFVVLAVMAIVSGLLIIIMPKQPGMRRARKTETLPRAPEAA